MTAARVNRTGKAVSGSGAGLLLIYPSQLTASGGRFRRERIDWALRIANDPETALALERTLETGRRLSLTHMVLGGLVKTCKVAGRDPQSEESLLWFLGMFAHTPGDFLTPPFV